MCGTVNQASADNVVSQTNMYLVKLNNNCDVTWTKIIHTNYPSYGIDIMQTSDGGYFLSGQAYSSNNKFNLLVIKTDPNGNVQ